MTTTTEPTLTTVEQIFHEGRSARAWSTQPVDDALVRRVYDTVRWGPTLMNTSPLRLLLVRSPEARERLVSHMAEGNRERVRSAPLAVVVAADADFHEHLDALVPHVPGARDRFADEATRARIAREQAWLQAGYLVVGLRSEGLDVGPMSGMDAAGIDADLLGGTAWHSLMVLNLGYPAAEEAAFPRAPRLEFDAAAAVA
ncbi:malonic semialdehyde reductase [Isoptericola sp. b441]|uniref:Malonic semialdehyde reductase n=1 Tax=Actinotalea lenta TaxID=3064654 RepID=A0ABT9D8P0_9CELL|nr:malonic semialdehyde reductase [Isoptericola sp. b441]MDO8105671.1 malonic semialdehyde reductase [Isoptericola sp. b441]